MHIYIRHLVHMYTRHSKWLCHFLCTCIYIRQSKWHFEKRQLTYSCFSHIHWSLIPYSLVSYPIFIGLFSHIHWSLIPYSLVWNPTIIRHFEKRQQTYSCFSHIHWSLIPYSLVSFPISIGLLSHIHWSKICIVGLHIYVLQSDFVMTLYSL